VFGAGRATRFTLSARRTVRPGTHSVGFVLADDDDDGAAAAAFVIPEVVGETPN